MPPRNLLNELVIDEISLVDDPANPHARVALMKSLTAAIPGASQIRAALGESYGDPAVAAFDAAFASVSPQLAVLVSKEADEIDAVLAETTAALGQSIDEIMKDHGTGADTEVVVEQFATEIRKAFKPFGKKDEDAKGKPKAKPKANSDDGDTFDTCKSCPTEKACTSAGKCAQQKDSKVSKNATVAGMVDALGESLDAILADTTIDQTAAITKSLSEFTEAVALAVKTAPNKEPPMSDPAESEVFKAMQTDMAAMRAKLEGYEKAETDRAAVSKAKALLPNGGPVEQVAEFFRTADDASAKLMTTLITTLQAQADQAGGNSAIYKALGVSNPDTGEMGESEIVKQAKIRADRAEKVSGRRRAA